MSPVVVSQNARVAIATWDDILISIWRSDVEAADIKPIATARSPSPRRAGKGQCAGVAVIIGVDGFTGAAVRAAIAGVHILSRSKTPTRSFAGVPPAAHWMYEQLRRDLADMNAFVAAVERLRAGN